VIDVQWMQDLYEDMPGWVDVRSFDPSGKHKPVEVFCQGLGELGDVLTRLDGREGWNVYTAIATRSENTSAGRKEKCAASRAVWIDYDFGVHPGATWAERVAAGAAAFDEKVRTFPLPPSLVVDSGGGRHAYWLFEEPWPLFQAEQRARLEAINKGLQLAFGSDGSVWDCSRVLRVPGTRNWPDAKKAAAGRTMVPSRNNPGAATCRAALAGAGAARGGNAKRFHEARC